jgi:hypothetical protein
LQSHSKDYRSGSNYGSNYNNENHHGNNYGGSHYGSNHGQYGGGHHSGKSNQDSITIQVPNDSVGLIIGKGMPYFIIIIIFTLFEIGI